MNVQYINKLFKENKMNICVINTSFNKLPGWISLLRLGLGSGLYILDFGNKCTHLHRFNSKGQINQYRWSIRERVIKNRPPVSKPRRECKRETRLIKGNWGLGPRLHPPVQMALFPYQSPIVAWTKLKKTAWSPRHQEERQMPVRRGQF